MEIVALTSRARRTSRKVTQVGGATEIDEQPFVGDNDNLSEYVGDKIVARRREKVSNLYKARRYKYIREGHT